jgi:hypothetical protein
MRKKHPIAAHICGVRSFPNPEIPSSSRTLTGGRMRTGSPLAVPEPLPLAGGCLSPRRPHWSRGRSLELRTGAAAARTALPSSPPLAPAPAHTAAVHGPNSSRTSCAPGPPHLAGARRHSYRSLVLMGAHQCSRLRSHNSRTTARVTRRGLTPLDGARRR